MLYAGSLQDDEGDEMETMDTAEVACGGRKRSLAVHRDVRTAEMDA